MTDEKLSYEQARTELADVVERLEAGGSSLEESLALWERGEQLADVCQRWLDGARERIDAGARRRTRDRRLTRRAGRAASAADAARLCRVASARRADDDDRPARLEQHEGPLAGSRAS